jgi:hypothetical protein
VVSVIVCGVSTCSVSIGSVIGVKGANLLPLRAAERVCLGIGTGLERALRFGLASLTTFCKLKIDVNEVI